MNTKNVNFIGNDDASYEDVSYDFGTPKGPTFSP